MLQMASSQDPQRSMVAIRKFSRCRIASLKPFDEAEKTGKKAVELEPDNGEAHYFLGVSYLVRADEDGDASYHAAAVKHFKATAQLIPMYQAAFMNLASINLSHGDYENAR